MLGDMAARTLRMALIESVVLATEGHDGTAVDLTGDGVFARFESAVAALEAATEMQAAVAFANRTRQEKQHLQLRVGVHTGEPIEGNDGSLLGLAVVVARRLCDRAGDREILVSDLTRSLVDSHPRYAFTRAGPQALKGIDQPVVGWWLGVNPLFPAATPATAAFTAVGIDVEGNVDASPYVAAPAWEDVVPSELRVGWADVVDTVRHRSGSQRDGGRLVVVAGQPSATAVVLDAFRNGADDSAGLVIDVAAESTLISGSDSAQPSNLLAPALDPGSQDPVPTPSRVTPAIVVAPLRTFDDGDRSPSVEPPPPSVSPPSPELPDPPASPELPGPGNLGTVPSGPPRSPGSSKLLGSLGLLGPQKVAGSTDSPSRPSESSRSSPSAHPFPDPPRSISLQLVHGMAQRLSTAASRLLALDTAEGTASSELRAFIRTGADPSQSDPELAASVASGLVTFAAVARRVPIAVVAEGRSLSLTDTSLLAALAQLDGVLVIVTTDDEGRLASSPIASLPARADHFVAVGALPGSNTEQHSLPQLRTRFLGGLNPPSPAGAADVPTRLVRSAPASLHLPGGGGVPVSPDGVVIGRGHEAGVRVDDADVSRRHLRISAPAGRWLAEDLGSANGTHVNGVEVREHSLVDGDEITIGATVLRFVIA